MYARVVRFTDVDPERVRDRASRTEGGEGPPPGVPAKSFRVIVDDSQSTAVVIFFFDSEEDMRTADEALNAMDAGETPGTRASVDQGEVKAEFEAS
jgi:hypothetical protein